MSLGRSKTNQTGEQDELVVLPRSGNPARCPVLALEHWIDLARIGNNEPLLQGVTKANRASGQPLNTGTVNLLVQAAVARAGISPVGYSAHSLRAGFVTWAHLRGASDRAIAHQTRHRSLATLGQYVRIHEAWTDNAATSLGL